MDHWDKNRLWDEYKYRHQHCWNTVFKLVIALVLISVIPYTQREVACVLSWRILVVPLLAVCVSVFGYLRVRRELMALADIKVAHQRAQGILKPETGYFGRDTRRFLLLLILVAVVNLLVVWLVWLPAVESRSGAGCFETRLGS